MKMKALDCALIGILSALVMQAAVAQEQTADAAGVDCTSAGCVAAQGELLMQVRTRGKRQPQTVEAPETTQALQSDRRVTVEAVQPGKAVAVGKWSVQMPGGGVVWATEDPNLGQPQLDVSATSLVAFDGSRITRPVRFFSYSNYSAFIERAEVRVFRANDSDLVAPLATIPLPVAAVADVEWDGVLPADARVRAGDELLYVVRAWGADGAFDETWPRRMQLVAPDEAQRGGQALRSATERKLGQSLGSDEAEARSLVDDVFDGNGLRVQNIPVYGSRIRIQGHNLPDNASVRINGRSFPLDTERKLVAEFLEPVGQHRFEIEMNGHGLSAPVTRTLDVDVSGKYMFAMALADFTLSGNSVSGSIEPLAGDDHFERDLVVDGRLAFYLKGKVRGKYLVTAQADTQEREVGNLFSGFWKADPQDIFRRLDPDRYYPVYGDDSSTYRDIDTMGRLYVRVDWDKSQALWGNFNTGVTGTEYGQYSRSLYGGALGWRSRRSTVLGEAGSQLKVFGSEAQTAPGHSEFLGTGGSLYYLRHTDVLPGSERVVLEVRDPTTGRTEQRVDLVEGADYEIDAMQGRILLTRPLAVVTRENVPSLTRDMPLDGLSQVLLVDYEYVPQGFDADDVAAGVRGKHWFGDHVAIGGTYVDENRAGDDYTLAGADLTLQAGNGTYLKLEHSRTESTSAPVFFSSNGGLSFTRINPVSAARKGDARAVEARANFREQGWTELDWSAGAWWRQVDAGFSVSRFDIGQDVEEYGAEVLGQFSPGFNLYTRYSRTERGPEALTQAQATAEWRVSDFSTLGAELRRVEEQRASGAAAGVLAALQYKQRFGSSVELYGTAQKTLDDDGGRYADNDAVTAGGKYLFGNLSSVGAEATHGDRGDAAQVNAEYRLGTEHSIYTAYTHSTDRSPYDPLFNNRADGGWTIGQRWRLSNQVNLYNESQWLKSPSESGLARTFGMDFYPALGWNMGFTLQQAELDTTVGGVDREAVSVNGGRTSNATQWQSKLEWRRDTGAERREQWVSSNRLAHKLSESFRIAGRLNYSRTRDELLAAAGAKFVEGNLGFAWRPWDGTRWAMFGRYTYLYDVSALSQEGVNVADYDQRSQVLSMEGVFKADDRWELAAKLARREGEVRMGRLVGAWADSATTFAAGQVRYDIGGQWHALGEYRWLDVDDGGAKSGFLAGVDRDLGRNFRVGVGYNFTRFSDDLTNFDYDHQGFFLNVVGRY
ncbi:hypothetical protein [Pseudoxanthomonas suwonensis]|uniref:Uncharacterized protein n=1 Tax=Pseudoxanthomonas suwonensis TaxID=314722 RepID=A0A0E3UPM9_9GAMM|nr:hypothetical protein [Pseudoxanthomonas suwonensis]AKC88181.1 hypothetical protein WQ53_04730 [Pseudoxanthomonas suwonensis]